MKKTKIKMIKPLYLGMSILDIKHFSMNFGMTVLNQSMETEQNCITRIMIALLFIL